MTNDVLIGNPPYDTLLSAVADGELGEDDTQLSVALRRLACQGHPIDPQAAVASFSSAL